MWAIGRVVGFGVVVRFFGGSFGVSGPSGLVDSGVNRVRMEVGLYGSERVMCCQNCFPTDWGFH